MLFKNVCPYKSSDLLVLEEINSGYLWEVDITIMYKVLEFRVRSEFEIQMRDLA